MLLACQIALNSAPQGMRTKTWTGLSRKSEALSVFDGAEKAKRDFDPPLVVPADVGINYLDKLLDGRGLPGLRVEQFRFQPAKEAFACSINR